MLENSGITTRVIDLRWLAPLPVEAMLAAVKDCAHVLIVDECRFVGGQAEALICACALADVAALADDIEVVAVTGNSMGWFLRLPLAAHLARKMRFAWLIPWAA